MDCMHVYTVDTNTSCYEDYFHMHTRWKKCEPTQLILGTPAGDAGERPDTKQCLKGYCDWYEERILVRGTHQFYATNAMQMQ